MAFRALRRTVAEIDEGQLDSRASADHRLDTDRSSSRRGFLTRAATGGAIAVGAAALPVSALVPSALAQTPDDGATTGTTSPAASSGPPPVVEGNDLEIVVFLQSIELAAIEAYQAMIATGRLAPAVVETAREFTLDHTQQSAALADLAGGEAATEANPRLAAEIVPLMSNAADQNELATLGYNLEESIVATYAQALGQFESWQSAAVASRILPVDSQQALVWSQVRFPDPSVWANDITTWIPNFQSETGAIDIAGYPAR